MLQQTRRLDDGERIGRFMILGHCSLWTMKLQLLLGKSAMKHKDSKHGSLPGRPKRAGKVI